MNVVFLFASVLWLRCFFIAMVDDMFLGRNDFKRRTVFCLPRFLVITGHALVVPEFLIRKLCSVPGISQGLNPQTLLSDVWGGSCFCS